MLLCLTGCAESNPPDKSLEVALQGLYSGAISGNAKLAVVGSINHGASLWQLDNSKRLFDWNHRSGEKTKVTSVAFTPDGDFAATVEHSDIVLWDTQSGKSITWFAAPSEILAIDLSPGGQYAILGLVDHTAVLFDIRRGGGNLRVFNHEGRVRSVALSANAEILITGSEDDTGRAWNVSSGELLHSWKHREPVTLVAVSPDASRALTVSKYDRAVVWDVQTGAETGVVPLRATAVQRGLTFTSARFSHDGTELLTGTADRVVQLWNTASLSESARWVLPKRQAWKPTSATVLALAFTEDGLSYYAVASNGLVHQLKR